MSRFRTVVVVTNVDVRIAQSDLAQSVCRVSSAKPYVEACVEYQLVCMVYNDAGKRFRPSSLSPKRL